MRLFIITVVLMLALLVEGVDEAVKDDANGERWKLPIRIVLMFSGACAALLIGVASTL